MLSRAAERSHLTWTTWTRLAMTLLVLTVLAIPTGGHAQESRINGLMYLIQNDPEDAADGLLKWQAELRKRRLTALIKASKPVLEKYPEVFRRLARDGHVIMGGYAGICWDMPYGNAIGLVGIFFAGKESHVIS